MRHVMNDNRELERNVHFSLSTSKVTYMSLSKFQREKCLKMIDKLISWPICSPFIEMVDPERDGAPDYFEYIKEPMSLNEVKSKLINKKYRDMKEFTHDVRLIWQNARTYNGEDTLFTHMAMEASIWFDKKIDHFPNTLEEEWVDKVQKIAFAFYDALAHPPADLIQQPTKSTTITIKAEAFDTNPNNNTNSNATTPQPSSLFDD